LNGLNNITPHGLGCGSRKATMKAPSVDYNAKVMHNSGGVSLDENGTGLSVPITTLDELIAPELNNVRLIKIDVEGMEQEVLIGSQKLINEYRPLLYVENDRIEKSQALIEWIMAANYRLWWHSPHLFNADNFFGTSENIYGNIASFNMICIPKEISLAVTSGMQEITDPCSHPFKE
jgi:hypothetical protein